MTSGDDGDRRARAPRRAWRACCSSATRCSRSAASRSRAGSNRRSSSGWCTDAETLLAYTRTAVEQADRGDGIALVCAHRAAAAGDLDEPGAHRPSGVRAQAVERDADDVGAHGQEVHRDGCAGDRRAAAAAWRERIEAGATPGAIRWRWRLNFAAQGLPARDAFAVHQYGVAAMILSAALRLMRIDHVDTQRMLYPLNAARTRPTRPRPPRCLSDMAGFAPLAEILAAVHVKAHVRLFMN